MENVCVVWRHANGSKFRWRSRQSMQARLHNYRSAVSAVRSSQSSSARVSLIAVPSWQERSSSAFWAPISAQVGNGWLST